PENPFPAGTDERSIQSVCLAIVRLGDPRNARVIEGADYVQCPIVRSPILDDEFEAVAALTQDAVNGCSDVPLAVKAWHYYRQHHVVMTAIPSGLASEPAEQASRGDQRLSLHGRRAATGLRSERRPN